MMRTTITRTLATSKITGYKVVVKDGVPSVESLPVVTVAGKAKEKDALKALENEYGKGKGISVGKIEVSEAVYEISVEKFLKYATKKGSDASEEVAETNEEQATEATATNEEQATEA